MRLIQFSLTQNLNNSMTKAGQIIVILALLKVKPQELTTILQGALQCTSGNSEISTKVKATELKQTIKMQITSNNNIATKK